MGKYQTRISELMALKLAGEATADELQELAAYLKEDPKEAFSYALMEEWWSQDHTEAPLQQEHMHRNFERMMEKAKESMAQQPQTAIVRPIFKYKWVAAAIGIILISFGAYYMQVSQVPTLLADQDVSKNVIVAQRGTKSKLILPDGTKVWLNSESRLTYDSQFSGTYREVTLEGEAYFDVVKNPNRPFIVHTSGINIRVLGTAFNVKSYPTESTIEATLVRGLIEVEKNNDPHASKILLKPHEKLVYNKADRGTQKSSTNASEDIQAARPLAHTQQISISAIPKNLADTAMIETSWVYGKLIFEGDSFETLASKMERWFNVKIRFAHPKVAAYRFGGVFENENIEEALQALQLTADFKYKIEGNEVVIDKK